ncbi:MAG: inositol monophosphatase family protein [Alphaproteobacteria bacterium]|nr:inositol monophosphatase family protein [Alphaproteobacteria bacterium]
MISPTRLTEFATFAERLADAARVILHDAGHGAIGGETKGDGSPVTAVDRMVEDRLRAMIVEAYPEHGVVGEERGACSADRELVWVLDPIDGTLPFLAGIPVYGTLIALVSGKASVLGVIEMPATGERWIGCKGRPTVCNGIPVNVRPCPDLSGAMLSTSNPDFYAGPDVAMFQRLKERVRWTVYGGSCMAYAQIASGRIDLGVDVAFDPFDYLALVPVIEGAGGVITDWAGAPLTLESGDRLITAGDRRTHAQAIACLSSGQA